MIFPCSGTPERPRIAAARTGSCQSVKVGQHVRRFNRAPPLLAQNARALRTPQADNAPEARKARIARPRPAPAAPILAVRTAGRHSDRNRATAPPGRLSRVACRKDRTAMKAMISKRLYSREFRDSLWGAVARGLIGAGNVWRP